jgi:V/A-type H+/Na+-transporting ATPase subunit K
VTRGEAIRKIVKFSVGMGLVMVVAAAGIAFCVSAAMAQEKPAPTGAEKAPTVQSPETMNYKGMVAIAIGILVAGGSFAAAYAVASVGSAAVGAVTEKPDMMGRALVFVALAEGIAIYGLLMAFLLLFGLQK